MTFHFIHSSIIDLYINSLTLFLLEEKLRESGPDALMIEMQQEIDKAASSYVLSVREAEGLFGSSEAVQRQLDVFSAQRKGSA